MSIDPMDRSKQVFLATGIAVLLFVLCFGGTPALRFLLGLVVGVAGFASFRVTSADKTVVVLITLWVIWCFVTAAWSPAPVQTLRAAIEEALLPAGCFLAAAALARSGAPLGWVQAGQFGGLAVLFVMTAGIFVHGGWMPLVSHDNRPQIFSSYPGSGVVTSHFVMALPFMVFWIRRGQRGKAWAMVFAAMALLLGVLANNRMYWLTLMALCIGVAPLFIADLRRHLGKRMWVGLLLLLLALVALLAYTMSQRTPGGKTALATMEQTVSSDTRWRGWQLWLDKGMQHPIIGVGFGKKALRKSLTDKEKAGFSAFEDLLKGHPHNYFITTWVATGTVGLLLNVAMFAVIAGTFLVRRRESDTGPRDACAVGILLIVALFAKNLTDDQFSNAVPFYFWTLLGLAYGLASPSSRRKATAVPAVDRS